MKVIVCVEDQLGMMFNKRRVSKDQKVIEDVKRLVENDVLWIHPYSEKLFAQGGMNLNVDDQFLERAQSSDYCFVENHSLFQMEEKISEMIIYHWNRRYPSDLKLKIDLSLYDCISIEEFVGSSHEKVTKELYVKRK